MRFEAEAAWIALSLTEHLGGKTLRALVEAFDGDLEAILLADEAELRRVPGIGIKIAASIRAIRLDDVQAAMEQWMDEGIFWLTAYDSRYPPSLKALEDAPPTLFYRGNFAVMSDPALRRAAVVGTRQPTPQAVKAAEALAFDLAAHDVIVVSGLALGIDAAAHRGALAAGGRSIAVLGGSILRPYPHENRGLAAALIRSGALACEVNPLSKTRTPALVARNRLISGLSETVIVVETAKDGGAMYAARRAFEQGRIVMTYDFPASGNQALIMQGAVVIPSNANFTPD